MDKMNEMWLVCELEESRNIKLSYFERFSVSAVPESWVLLREDGTLVCFWPIVDAASKIRTLKSPQIGEKGAYYNCRVLINGAKFATYKEAKEAEVIAQNFSSKINSSVCQEIENNCDGTMEFDVSDEDGTKEETADDGSFIVSYADADEQNDEIVSHDEEVLKINSRLQGAMHFEVENLENPDENLPIVPKNTIFSENDYNAKFKSNEANFLTSTVIDDMDWQNIEKSEVTEILLKISEIEMNVSSFTESIRNDLNNLKEVVKPTNKPEMREKITSKLDATKVHSPVQKSNVTFIEEFDCHSELDQKKNLAKKEEGRYFNGNDACEESNIQLQNGGYLLNSQTIDLAEDVHHDALNAIRNVNETFVAKSANISERASDVWHVQRPTVLNFEIMPAPAVSCTQKAHEDDIDPEEIVQCIQNAQEDVVVAEEAHNIKHTEHNATSANVLKLPLKSINDHKRNEELLDDSAFEEALIEHLAPFVDEDETSYMNRTIEMVFEENFLLKSVSWKKENNRINIKHSYLMSCWKESFGRKFDVEIGNAKFMEHFRRFKNSKRAAIKAKVKRLAKAAAKAAAKVNPEKKKQGKMNQRKTNGKTF